MPHLPESINAIQMRTNIVIIIVVVARFCFAFARSLARVSVLHDLYNSMEFHVRSINAFCLFYLSYCIFYSLLTHVHQRSGFCTESKVMPTRIIISYLLSLSFIFPLDLFFSPNRTRLMRLMLFSDILS